MKLNDDAQRAFRKQEYGQHPGIDGVRLVSLRRFRDEGGSMIELLRLGQTTPEGLDGFRPAQINYSTLEAGVVKAFHVHERQTDIWFVPPEDRVLVVLVDVRSGSSTEGRRMRLVLGHGDPGLLRIPPGVAHGCRNLGSGVARILYLTDTHFSAEPGKCDEGRLPWDFAGSDIWEIARE